MIDILDEFCQAIVARPARMIGISISMALDTQSSMMMLIEVADLSSQEVCLSVLDNRGVV